MPMLSPAIAPDRFTWSRVWATMRLMLPRLRATIAWYAVVGILASVMVYVLSFMLFGLKLFSLIIFIPALLYYISPVFVTDTMTAQQMTGLPATSAEKLVAIYIYVFVILGPIVYFLPTTVFKFILTDNGTYGGMNIGPTLEAVCGMHPLLYAVNCLSSALPALVGVYTMVRYPGRRWRAVGMVALTIFLEGLLGGIYGVYKSFRLGFEAAVNGGPSPDEMDMELITQEIVQSMMPFMWLFSVVCIILCVCFVMVTFRKMQRRQL